MDFDVERHDGSDPNKATIRVANLSEASRGYVEARSGLVTLSAGYGNPGIIFKGKADRTYNERNGPDIITVLECSDGGEALRLGAIDASIDAGVTDAQVIDRCIEILRGLGIGRGFVAPFKPRAYTKAFCYSGPIKRLMDDLCKRQGLRWGIENGVVEIVKDGPLRTEQPKNAVFKNTIQDIQATVLSAKSGLVGFPSKKANLLLASSLLNPNLRPRRAMKLVSAQTSLNGLYTIQKAKYHGNTRSGDWLVDIEAARDPSLREP
jgi:hypothetical protein